MNSINSANSSITTEVTLNNEDIQSYKSCSFHQNILQLNIPTPRSMKLILFAIIAFHFANFGEAQLVPDYCDCAVLWVRNIRDYMGLSNLSQCLVQNSLHSEMTGLIYQTWGQTGCPCDIDCHKNMFNVGHSILLNLLHD